MGKVTREVRSQRVKGYREGVEIHLNCECVKRSLGYQSFNFRMKHLILYVPQILRDNFCEARSHTRSSQQVRSVGQRPGKPAAAGGSDTAKKIN